MTDNLQDRLVAYEKVIVLSQSALVDCAQIIDVIKQEWTSENAWTEWDQATRNKITTALLAIHNLYADTPLEMS